MVMDTKYKNLRSINMKVNINRKSKENNKQAFYTNKQRKSLESHIKTYYGKIDFVIHELSSPDIHVDIGIIKPTSENNFYTLITMGMGAQKMNLPYDKNDNSLERCEILIKLPSNWNINFINESDFWPVKCLKNLARIPIWNNTWLGCGHAFANDKPFANNTNLCSVLLRHPYSYSREAMQVKLDNDTDVYFLQAIPLYEEEMNLGTAVGTDILYKKLFDNDFSDIVDINRKNCCQN
jgi:hypothetical protein